MRSQTLATVAVVSVLLAVPAWVQAKDLTLRQRVTTTGVRSDTHEATQYWTDNKMVTDSPDDRVIVDLGAQTMTVVDKRHKTYFTQTFAEMRQRSEAMRAEMQKEMENLPPEAREMMGKMGTGPLAAEPEISVKPTGKSEKIAGYEAKEYALEGGPMSASVWVTDVLQPPGGAKGREALGKMVAGAPGSKLAQAIGGVNGVPLRTVVRSTAGPGKGFTSTIEVIEVSEKTPPADALEVPAGFRKIAAPEMPPMHQRKGAPRN
jgi:hypothetical protein